MPEYEEFPVADLCHHHIGSRQGCTHDEAPNPGYGYIKTLDIYSTGVSIFWDGINEWTHHDYDDVIWLEVQ